MAALRRTQNPRLREERAGDGPERPATDTLERPRESTERASAGSVRPAPEGRVVRPDGLQTKEGKCLVLLMLTQKDGHREQGEGGAGEGGERVCDEQEGKEGNG